MSIPTNWDLSKHFYASPTDPQIDLDIAVVKQAYQDFVDKYQSAADYLRDPQALKTALDDYDQLSGSKPIYYFHYLRYLNSADPQVEARFHQLNDLYSQLGNKIIFFELKLGKISKSRQKQFLADPLLAPYHYYLKRLFETARFDLSEEVEKIINRLSLPSAQLWTQGVSKQLSQLTVRFEGERLSLPEAGNRVPQLPTSQRRQLHRLIMRKQRLLQGFAESEINAVYIRKKILDGERGYPQPYSATFIGNNNTEEEVLSLIDAVTANFDIPHRFYQLKAKMLGETKLGYADRAAQIGELDIPITFKESYRRLAELFGSLKPEYAQTFIDIHQNGQVDVYPRQYKAGGAFCSSSSDNPTFVLLNWVDSLNAYLTHAHEFGHAIHAQASKSQPLRIYQGHSTSLAETASTFFEGLAFNALLANLSPQQQTIALHDRLQDDISTVFRQVACFNFELELHQRIRQEGFLNHQEISRLMNRHMAAYLGPAVKLTKNDGYFWIGWGHIRRFFYIYTYAYGQLVSMALRQKVKADLHYIKQVDQFLSAGNSQSPSSILKNIGIVTDKQFFETGLSAIRSDLEQLETLVNIR